MVLFRTGWLKLEGKWYWLKADGTRAASEWITYDNNRYYFDGDGVMYTGMKEVDGTRYYFHSWGGVYHNESFTWQGRNTGQRMTEPSIQVSAISMERNTIFWKTASRLQKRAGI